MEVAVLGADTVGRGIAQVCALAGHDVSLHDAEANVVMDGIDAVQAGIGDVAAAGDVTDEERAAAVDRLEGTTGLDAAVADTDIVIEATELGRDGRRDRFADIEDVVTEETLVATSAPDVSVTAAATGLRKPGRALGLHFIDPPEAPLVEVVVAEQTTETTRDAAVEFVDGLGTESAVVRDVPGFAATRLSLSLTVEAIQMVDERVAGIAAIDRAMERGHDHPVGPLAAADMAGLDARLDQLEYLAESLGERFEPPPVLREKVAAGELGRKTGAGFYVWEGGERVEPADPDPRPDLRSESPPGPDEF